MPAGAPGTYLYGIVATPDAGLSLAGGVGDPPAKVRLLADGDLGALVSEAPADIADGLARDLLAHARVLEDAVVATTVVPMRFGMVLPDEQAVRDRVLAPRRAELTGLLERFRGQVEIGVKGYYHQETVLAEIVTEDAEVRRLRARGSAGARAPLRERMRVGELVAAALERKRAEDAARLIERLEPLTVAVRTTPPTVEQMVANAAFLLHRDRLEAFDEAVEALNREANGRLLLKAVGPVPPYSFVPAGTSDGG